jgi:23S rRNA (guanosine2251-2'-O)-methyltransferase
MSKTQKIFGKNAVMEALDSDISINKVWIANNPNPRLKEIETKARSRKIPVLKLSKKDLDRIADNADHRSVIAEIAATKLLDEDYLYQNELKRILIPMNIEDPHNLGAIMRSALAFGVDAIVLGKHKGCPVNETVLRVSSGAASKLAIVRAGNIVNCLKKLKEQGFWVYGTHLDKTRSQDLYKIDFDKKSVILVGNEGKGLSDNIIKNCDFTIHIPIEFESLNVSVATGIILSRCYATTQ